MGTRALENRIKKLQEIKAQQKDLEAQAEAIKAEIKKQMEEQGTNEIHTPSFVVRFKSIISERFDSKSVNHFKADHKSLYEAYTKSSTTRRFTVA